MDIYEVEKRDYDAYFFRLPKEDLEEERTESQLIYRDKLTGNKVCGIEIQEHNHITFYRYFIFEFLDEERLGPHKGYKQIVVSKEEYEKLLKAYAEKLN